MKKLWLLMAVNFLLTACGAMPTGSITSEAKPAVNDTVAFKVSREGFGEGKVESIDGTRYKIKYGDSTETKDDSDVYPLPKSGAKPQVKAGDMVVAKIESGNYWSGAEVLSANGDVIEVKELWHGKTASLSPDKIIVVRAAAVAEFQKLKAENEFSAKAKQGKPHPPAGYKPKVGDHVVAEWSANAWWVGDVTKVNGEKASVKWESFPEKELTLNQIMPFPKAETSTALPAANSYVLVKPAGGSGQWNYAQVTNVNGDSAEVKFPSGKTQTIKADEYIALS